MICFYHSADFDGFCSGAIVKHRFPDCELVGFDYKDTLNMDLIDGEIVYMVDVAPQPYELMSELAERTVLHWIDHHRKAIKAFYKQRVDTQVEGSHTCPEALMDNPNPRKQLAGCELAWQYMFLDRPMPYAVKLLGRYDVWDHSYDPNVLPFQYGLRAIAEDLRPENNMLFWETLFETGNIEINQSCLSNRLRRIVEAGNTVLQYEKKQSGIYCSATAFEVQFANLPTIVVNRALANSTQFESVYDPARHKLMLAFCWYKRHWKFSLYSDHDDVDCGEIAAVFGGGGHKNAGGFYVERLPLAIYQAMHGAAKVPYGVAYPCP